MTTPLSEAFREADRGSIPRALIRHPDPERVPCTADDLELPEQMDGDDPLVSVVLPTHEDDDCLPDALQSVGAQTHRALELLVVDSSRVEWIESLANDRDWIRYIPQESAGPSAARNDGIEAARGEFVALLDADDYWHPEKIERQVAALDPADVVYADSYVVDPDGDGDPGITLAGGSPETPERAYVERLTGGIDPHTSSLVFRRSAVSDRPFRESLDNYEDVVFMVDLFERSPPERVAEPLSVRRKRAGSHGHLADDSGPTGYFDKLDAIDYLAETHPELSSLLDRRRAQVQTSIGMAYLAAGDRAAARRYLSESLRSGDLGLEAYKPITLYLASLLPVEGSTAVRALERVQDRLIGGGSREGGVEVRRSAR